MERKNKACWNCRWYKAYYTKGWCYFDKLSYGLCKRKNQTVDKRELCEGWYSNSSLRKLRMKIALAKLEELTDSITEIRQVLVEEQQEKQEKQ